MSSWAASSPDCRPVDPAPEPYPETPEYPEGITAEEVADKVLDNLPEGPSPKTSLRKF